MIIEKVKIEKLKAAKYNPRKNLKPGDPEYEKLKKSIEEFDYIEPIVWNRRSGNVVGGHQRLKILKEKGHTEVDVSVVDLDDDKEMALNLALNKTGGTWDIPMLSEIVESLSQTGIDMGITGFSDKEIAELIAGKNGDEIIEDDFDADAAAGEIIEPITKRGDIWILGMHRLMCGDSTDEKDIEILMNREKATICFTSPPYNAGELNIKGNESTKKKYNVFDDNQTEEKYYNFLKKNLDIVLKHSKEVFYNIGLVEKNKRVIIDILANYKKEFKDIIYWKKNTAAPHIQPGIINNRVEFILCFGNGKRKFENATFKQGTYWNVIEGNNASGNEFSKIHRATFPLYLPIDIIKNFCPVNSVVLDCFGGTGTTLIAAEQTGRNAFLMELDPKYCDVIVKRWEKFTGQQAIKNESG